MTTTYYYLHLHFCFLHDSMNFHLKTLMMVFFYPTTNNNLFPGFLFYIGQRLEKRNYRSAHSRVPVFARCVEDLSWGMKGRHYEGSKTPVMWNVEFRVKMPTKESVNTNVTAPYVVPRGNKILSCCWSLAAPYWPIKRSKESAVNGGIKESSQ